MQDLTLQTILIQLAPIALIFAVFWLLVLRPQAKQAQIHKTMLSDLKKGDTLITTGGLYGTVKKQEDTRVLLTFEEGTAWVSKAAIVMKHESK